MDARPAMDTDVAYETFIDAVGDGKGDLTSDNINKIINAIYAINFRKIDDEDRSVMTLLLTAYLRDFYSFCHLTDIPHEGVAQLLRIAPHRGLSGLIAEHGEKFGIARLTLAQTLYMTGKFITSFEDVNGLGCDADYLDSAVNDLKNLEKRLEDGHRCVIGTLISVGATGELVNKVDSVLGEPIERFHLFDVVRYKNKEGAIISIVRTEFEKVFAEKRDPWLNRKVPVSALMAIQSRNAWAKRGKLGECRPALDMVRMVRGGSPVEKVVEDLKHNSRLKGELRKTLDSRIPGKTRIKIEMNV